MVGKRPKRRIALLHYPLSSQCNPSLKSDMHAAACPAAVWLEAAHKQRKVAKFLTAVAAHGTFSTSGTDNRKRKAKNRIKLHLELVAVAKSAGMNLRKARRFAKKAEAKALVATDLAQGKLAKVRGTPTIFIHGRRYKGPRTLDAFLRAIDKQP
ncbi:MAG TPA: hypothetical protein EYP98_05885 [Planctomycetes bacterium]|nr:hypothetical protein [Planctomycetota bacterium]